MSWPTAGDTWKTCGHPRTVENSIAFKLRCGCRTCGRKRNRRNYYQSKGEVEPLPKAYRHALSTLPRYRAFRNKSLGCRVIEILNQQEPMDRAAYILLRVYQYAAQEVADYLKEPAETLAQRAEKVKNLLSLTEARNMYKDWELVQQLVDEGLTQEEVKEVIGISQTGWNEAKRRGAVRV